MRTRKLKLEGNEKIKFEIQIEYNDITVVLWFSGTPTKYKYTYTLEKPFNEEIKDRYFEQIGIVCKKLYDNFIVGRTIQTDIYNMLEYKDVIEFDLDVKK